MKMDLHRLTWRLASIPPPFLLGMLVPSAILLAFVIYRLFLHPLAKYPGPLTHRVCGLPTLYHAWRGDLHHHFYELHHRYGDYVRYSPNKLSICNTRAVNDIYGFNKNVVKPEEFYSAFRINAHAINTFNTSSKEAHRRKRRIMAKAFSETALISYEDLIAEKVAEFMEKMRKIHVVSNGEADFAYEFNCLMLDIMGALCFGEAFGFVSGQGEEFLRQAHLRSFRIYMNCHEPLLKRSYLDRLFFPALTRASNILGNYAKTNTFNRIAKYNSGGGTMFADKNYLDIMSHLLEAGDEETGTKYSDNELLGEGVLMMMAGSDTSSSALTATLFHLAHNKRVQRKVRKEIHARFPLTADIKPRETETCEYLRACIDEAMRLNPPAPTNIPRVVNSGGVTVDGHLIEEGAYVGVPNFALFRDERCFGGNLDPHAYIPERWIPGESIIVNGGEKVSVTTEDVKLAQSAFLPFSMGPRHCIGKHLAMREVSLILGTLLHEFEVEAVGDSGLLQHKLSGTQGTEKGHITMEQSDVYTAVEHDVIIRLKRDKEKSSI